MINIRFVVLMLCLFKASQCSKLLKCSTMEFPSQCPAGTICTQILDLETAAAAASAASNNTHKNQTDGRDGTKAIIEDGECRCKDENYEFNANYNGRNEYCVHVDARNRVPGTTGTGSESDAVTGEHSLSSISIQQQQQQPASHHIVGGILISICFVCLFIVVVIGLKKLRIRQRFREFRMNRRNRPLYEDVQLGNDTDDPPLI